MDAANFLLHVWQTLGIPEYTQVDNEACFSGGFTHPGVLGKVLRLALSVGTQLVFSPIRHPESNGYIERFHQDYTKNVWNKINLPNLESVQQHSAAFFEAYRHSEHHYALNGHCPADLHPALVQSPAIPEPCFSARMHLREGQVHFIRRIEPDNKVMILNLKWDVPAAKPNQGVWATLRFTKYGASLMIYDQAPDVNERICLVEHSFPLQEEVVPLSPESVRSSGVDNPSLVQSLIEMAVESFFGPVSSML